MACQACSTVEQGGHSTLKLKVHVMSTAMVAQGGVLLWRSPLPGNETRQCHVQIAVRGDDRALAIRGQLLLELHYLAIRRQSAERHGLQDVIRGCIKRAYLIRKLLDGPDGPLNDQVVTYLTFT